MDKQLENGVWKKKLIRHIGTAKSELDLKFLDQKAKEVLHELKHKNQLELEFPSYEDMTGLRTVGEFHQGADMVLGALVDRLRISSPNPSLLRYLVIARILHPVSKIRTVSFLNRNFGTRLEKDQVYRFLDNLSKFQDEILDSVKQYVVTNYPSSLNFILYDVTTLYFETDHDDEDVGDIEGLRKKGFSKEKRDDLPQVVLGLGVNSLGMPLTYRIYPGNTYEGSTLISGIDDTLKSLNQTTLTVVGDAGMLSENNLIALEERNLTYIVGTRLIGKQAELWPNWRYFGFLTDLGGTTVEADQFQRNRAVIELSIRDLKDSALEHLPSGDFSANGVWLSCPDFRI